MPGICSTASFRPDALWQKYPAGRVETMSIVQSVKQDLNLSGSLQAVMGAAIRGSYRMSTVCRSPVTFLSAGSHGATVRRDAGHGGARQAGAVPEQVIPAAARACAHVQEVCCGLPSPSHGSFITYHDGHRSVLRTHR